MLHQGQGTTRHDGGVPAVEVDGDNVGGDLFGPLLDLRQEPALPHATQAVEAGLDEALRTVAHVVGPLQTFQYLLDEVLAGDKGQGMGCLVHSAQRSGPIGCQQQDKQATIWLSVLIAAPSVCLYLLPSLRPCLGWM